MLSSLIFGRSFEFLFDIFQELAYFGKALSVCHGCKTYLVIEADQGDRRHSISASKAIDPVHSLPIDVPWSLQAACHIRRDKVTVLVTLPHFFYNRLFCVLPCETSQSFGGLEEIFPASERHQFSLNCKRCLLKVCAAIKYWLHSHGLIFRHKLTSLHRFAF